MSPEDPDTSVVIISYNRCERLPGLMDALLSDPGLLEAVVVLDGSTDGSEEWLRERSQTEPRLRYLRTENRGKESARQTGAELARGSYVVFLDDDVVPEPNLVSGHRARHGDREDLVVVGYMPVAQPTERSDAWIVREYRHSYEECVESWLRDPEQILQRLWSGNCSFSQAGIRAMGGVGCQVRLNYHQDKLMGWRAKAAGLTGVFAPELVGHHHYERNLSGYRRDCYAQGYARAAIALMNRPAVSECLGQGGDRLLGPAPVAKRRHAWVAALPLSGPLRDALSVAVRFCDRRDWAGARDRIAGTLGNLERAVGAIDAVRQVRAGALVLSPWDETLALA